MSKYIIEIPDDVQYVLFNGKTDNKYYTAVHPIAELEELNSDYINEHYGELQDEAYQCGYDDGYEAGCDTAFKPVSDAEYQRGFEDGKWKAEDGCDGCKYYEDTSLTNPCSECSRGCVDHYKPASDPDRIEVGDEVISDTGTKFTVTGFTNSDAVCGFSARGLGCFNTIDKLTKTGKHYDIQSILEAMRE